QDRLRTCLPRFGFAARFEEPQARVPSLGKPELIEELGVILAVAFEVGRRLDRQLPREVALDHLIARDGVTIHAARRRAGGDRVGGGRGRRGGWRRGGWRRGPG